MMWILEVINLKTVHIWEIMYKKYKYMSCIYYLKLRSIDVFRLRMIVVFPEEL